MAALLEEAEDEVLAFYASRPTTGASCARRTRCARPTRLERFNREIGRRTDVVGIFSDHASLIRLVSMLAIEANDEWLVGRRYLSVASMEGWSSRTWRRRLAGGAWRHASETTAA